MSAAEMEGARVDHEARTVADELIAKQYVQDAAYPPHPLSLGEQLHDGSHCHLAGQPHLGPCITRTAAAPHPEN